MLLAFVTRSTMSTIYMIRQVCLISMGLVRVLIYKI